MLLTSGVAWVTTTVAAHPAAAGTDVGAAIARSSHAGDTVVSAFGNADIVLSSGLGSPYPQLWSLPAQTLDPGMRLLRRTLAGPSAPTWFVVRGHGTADRLAAAHVAPLLHQDYRDLGAVCGRTVFLHRGLSRPPLLDRGRCPPVPSAAGLSESRVAHVLREVT